LKYQVHGRRNWIKQYVGFPDGVSLYYEEIDFTPGGCEEALGRAGHLGYKWEHGKGVQRWKNELKLDLQIPSEVEDRVNSSSLGSKRTT
jgi:hypothetical protein